LKNFQVELSNLGYRFQFITLAGFHATNLAVFDFANKYKKDGMLAYANLQQKEFESEKSGYTSTKHQHEVGVGYFDLISQAVGATSVRALEDSTESSQFHEHGWLDGLRS
jgi:isocitrate lyase